ncbi:hypothetical protein [Aureimonas sp. Leaf454]|uniref:hypothetical protein n=1 Tax=Aureimonas sp. Leaf454 TaxID=1736381 RepID=UPI0009EA42CD|nr:hypothetical protein [Aureimonas sp. Leaf454]
MDQERPNGWFRLRGRMLEVFGRRVELPRSRYKRMVIGGLFILGGCLSILPIFGIWMLPLGLLILSIDIALVRRWRRRSEVRWSRWWTERRLARAERLAARELAARGPDHP